MRNSGVTFLLSIYQSYCLPGEQSMSSKGICLLLSQGRERIRDKSCDFQGFPPILKGGASSSHIFTAQLNAEQGTPFPRPPPPTGEHPKADIPPVGLTRTVQLCTHLSRLASPQRRVHTCRVTPATAASAPLSTVTFLDLLQKSRSNGEQSSKKPRQHLKGKL